MFKEKRVWK